MQTAPSCPHGTETTIQRLSLLDSKPGHVAVCLLDCISSFQFDHTQHLPLQTALITPVYFLHSDKIHKISSYVDLTLCRSHEEENQGTRVEHQHFNDYL